MMKTPNAATQVAIALGLLALLSPLAHAAPAVDRAAIETQYRLDRSACTGKQDPSSREACLREAGAVRQEALLGKVDNTNTTPGDWRRNALARCQAHQDALDRSVCERRMRGEGETLGSVEGGGLLRQITTTVDPVPTGSGTPTK
jgi:hypothetical protein